jgi:hypothetical protein
MTSCPASPKQRGRPLAARLPHLYSGDRAVVLGSGPGALPYASLSPATTWARPLFPRQRRGLGPSLLVSPRRHYCCCHGQPRHCHRSTSPLSESLSRPFLRAAPSPAFLGVLPAAFPTRSALPAPLPTIVGSLSAALLSPVPLPCVGIFARAAPCHRASHLLIARADAPAAPPTSSFSRRRCRQHPLPGPAQAPARLDTPRRPPLHRLRWIRRCRGLPGRIHVAATFPARSAVPFGWIASSRLDPSLPWPSRPDLLFPLLFRRGRGHHDRRRRVRCCWPPWRGSLTPG